MTSIDLVDLAAALSMAAYRTQPRTFFESLDRMAEWAYADADALLAEKDKRRRRALEVDFTDE